MKTNRDVPSISVSAGARVFGQHNYSLREDGGRTPIPRSETVL